MTTPQETQEGVAEAASGTRQASRHRAAGSLSAPARSTQDRQLRALAVAPCAAASLLGLLAVFVLARASHAPLRKETIAALVLLGIVLLAVITAGFVWAGHLAETATSRVVEQSGAAWQPESALAPPVPQAPPAPAESAEKEVFVHLSRRLQSLVARQIDVLDDLENRVEEPGLLKSLFAVDHLSTRMRRHAESLGVLGGALPRRQWTRPVSVTEVLRSAVSETIDYPRVQVIADATALLNGYAVADVVHLLAELIENATSFSPQETKVVVRTQDVPVGLAIEIDDRGLGMKPQGYSSFNALLRDPAPISFRQLFEGARIGLYVVARLAGGHKIPVQLERNITGGTRALVVLPHALLAEDPEAESAAGGALEPDSEPTVWRPGDAPGDDGSTDSSLARTAARTASVPSGSLPAPRRAVDPQAPVSSGIRGSASSVQTPVPKPRNPTAAAPLGGSQPQPGAPEQAVDAVRPPLPRRQPQQHLSPSLAEPADSGTAERVGDGELTPGLMAGFKLGMARGYEQPTAGAHPNEHAPTQEGRS